MSVITGRIVRTATAGGGAAIPVPNVGQVVESAVALRALAVAPATLPGVLMAQYQLANPFSGGGSFIASATTATDNGGTRFNAGGEGSTGVGWQRIYQGAWDARWFGFVGDDSTDNADMFDRLWAALTSAASASRTVLFAPGIYRTSRKVAFPSQCRITGLAPRGMNTLAGSARIKFTGASGDAFSLTNCIQTHVEDIVLDGGGGADTTLAFHTLVSECSFERVAIMGAKTGLTGGMLIDFYEDVPGVSEIDNLVFRRCLVAQNPADYSEHTQYGIHNTNTQAFNITFEHCVIRSNKYNAYFSTGSCNLEHCQMFGWDSHNVLVATVAQPFTMLDVYSEGTDTGYFLEIYPSAGVTSNAAIRLIDCQNNSQSRIQSCCTQQLILENVVTAGDVYAEPLARYGTQHVVAHRAAFNSGKGFLGAGALTHVDAYDCNEAGVRYSRVANLRRPYDGANGDAHQCITAGAYWAGTLGADRAWALPGGAVVQTSTGPTVTHTGTSVSSDYRIRIKITTAGILGAGKFDWSLDDGATWEATGVTLAATVVLGTTGYTADFAAGAYNLNEEYAWSAEVAFDGLEMLVSRRGAVDAFSLNVGGVVTLAANDWAALAYDNNNGWTVMSSSVVSAPGGGHIYFDTNGDLHSVNNAGIDTQLTP